MEVAGGAYATILGASASPAISVWGGSHANGTGGRAQHSCKTGVVNPSINNVLLPMFSSIVLKNIGRRGFETS